MQKMVNELEFKVVLAINDLNGVSVGWAVRLTAKGSTHRHKPAPNPGEMTTPAGPLGTVWGLFLSNSAHFPYPFSLPLSGTGWVIPERL